MAQIIEAPNEIYSISTVNNDKLFLAGGISNCPDWQSEFIEMIKGYKNLTIYNPRRKNFPINDPTAAETQITWEYKHLKESDIITFWFSRGSLNPIVLFELGKYGLANDEKTIIIGIDPEYERKLDVEIQTKLEKPFTPIVYSLKDMARALKNVVDFYS